MAMTIRSSAFGAGEPIPTRYTADGANVSPPLTFEDVPEGAAELALICDDPDAPRADPWVHWVVYKVPADAGGLGEDVAKGHEELSDPPGARQGTNDFRRIGYGGPAPPRGHGTHHYHFKLYALDSPLKLAPGARKGALLDAMQGHILDTAEWIGTYRR